MRIYIARAKRISAAHPPRRECNRECSGSSRVLARPEYRGTPRHRCDSKSRRANPYLIKVVRKREGRRSATAYGSPVVNDASIIGGAQPLIGWLRQDLVSRRLLRMMPRQFPGEGLRPPASADLRRSIRRAVLMGAAAVVAHFYVADLASLWSAGFAIHLASGKGSEREEPII